MAEFFTKKYASSELFDEALVNSIEAYEASLNSQYLRVPKIINYNKLDLIIDFECMVYWQQLTSLIRSYNFLGISKKELDDIFFNIGSALAEYHNLTGKIHRDFDSTNVMFKPGENRICVIDFSRPDFADYPNYNKGNIYWDIALMLIHLCIKYPPNKFHCLIRSTNRNIGREFIRGYFSSSGLIYDYEALLKQYNYCLDLEYIKNTFVVRFLRWMPIFNLEDLKL